jgi:hypothetical protein
MDTAGVLDALLSQVRGQELEGLYERDWCESAEEPELPESIADHSLPDAVSTAADSAAPQILGLAQIGLDLAEFPKSNQERTGTDVVRSCSIGGSSFWSDAMDAEVLTVESTVDHYLPAAATAVDESLTATVSTAVVTESHPLPAAVSTAAIVVDRSLPAVASTAATTVDESLTAKVSTAVVTEGHPLPAAVSTAAIAVDQSLPAMASTVATTVDESLAAKVSTAATIVDHSLPAVASTAAVAVDHSLPAAVSTAATTVDSPLPAVVSTAADSAGPQIVDLVQFGSFHRTSAGTDVVRSCSIAGSTVSDTTDAESILSLDLSDEAAKLDLIDVPWFSK